VGDGDESSSGGARGAGGAIINGISTWRTDQLAYRGVKSSGIGRGWPRCALRDMTEERLVVFSM
jgi:acyl-CoA reductase-like NAD-dependent aldehyde dehydrogenase